MYLKVWSKPVHNHVPLLQHIMYAHSDGDAPTRGLWFVGTHHNIIVECPAVS